MRSAPGWLAGFAAALWLAASSCAPAGRQEPAVNVVILLIDALRADHLGCYGYPRNTSPAIDALALEAAVFEAASSPASWTKPAVASLLTGLYPIQHGVYTGNKADAPGRITSDVLHERHLTLAEALRRRGYRTAAFVRNAQLRSFLGFGQGFELYVEGPGDAVELTDRFLEWLRQRPGDRFLAYLHYLDVHWPYTPPAPFDRLFQAPQATVDFNDREVWEQLQRRTPTPGPPPTPEDLERMLALYDGEIRYTDAAIGQLVSSLRAMGLYDDTVIVLTSDHGEEFGEHGAVSHGRSLYHEVLHVPLIIRAPGLEPRRIEEPVELVDLMPTLLDLVGAPLPGGLAGRSLRPLLEGHRTPPRPVFAEHRPKGDRGRIWQSVRRGRYKLIRTVRLPKASGPPGGRWDAAIRPGMWLEVEGRAFEGDSPVALEIELLGRRREIHLSGPIQKLDRHRGRFRLAGVVCELGPEARIEGASGGAADPPALREGAWAKARGSRWRDGALRLTSFSLVEARAKWEIEAPAEAVEPGEDGRWRLQIAGVTVLLDRSTELDAEGSWPGGIARPAAAEGILLEVELYDLVADPGERHDLAAARPELVAELLAVLDAWERRHRSPPGATPRAALDAATLEELRALGYIR